MAARPQTTVFVSGLAASSDEATLLRYLAPFGEVMDVQLPKQRAADEAATAGAAAQQGQEPALPHRGFGFVVFATEDEAEDAIDNMHLNEMEGRIVNVSLARPSSRAGGGGGGGAGGDSRKAIWDDEVRARSEACVLSPHDLRDADVSRSDDRSGSSSTAAAVVARETCRQTYRQTKPLPREGHGCPDTYPCLHACAAWRYPGCGTTVPNYILT